MQTPPHATPEALLAVIKELVSDFNDYDKVSVGFPGYIKPGIICTAPNVSTEFMERRKSEQAANGCVK